MLLLYVLYVTCTVILVLVHKSTARGLARPCWSSTGPAGVGCLRGAAELSQGSTCGGRALPAQSCFKAPGRL